MPSPGPRRPYTACIDDDLAFKSRGRNLIEGSMIDQHEKCLGCKRLVEGTLSHATSLCKPCRQLVDQRLNDKDFDIGSRNAELRRQILDNLHRRTFTQVAN